MTDEPSVELPEGWRPEWGPPKRRLKKAENRRKVAEAFAENFTLPDLIPPRKATRKKLGIKPRPFDDALKAEIVERISNGELLSSILKDPEMPSRMQVWREQQKDEQFAADYAMAREVAAGVLADQILEISDSAAEDYRPDGSINYEVIARSKLRTDNRRWLLEKIDPKRWGNKVQTDITSGGEKIESKEINPLESARQVAFALELARRANGDKSE